MKEKEEEKFVGWSTKEMDQEVSNLLVKDMEEMVSLRSMSQDGVDECWMRIAEKIEEEVWDKYKVDCCSLQRKRCAPGVETGPTTQELPASPMV